MKMGSVTLRRSWPLALTAVLGGLTAIAMVGAGCGSSSGSSSGGPDASTTDTSADDVAMASSCPSTQSLCGSTCSTLSSDPANCGKCGKACATGQACSMGACVTSCGTGTTLCGQSCVETSVDPANCGSCGTACAAGETCTAGKCGCPASTPNSCGGADGGAATCTSVATDPKNCGTCGHACGAGQVCAAGTCASSCPGSSSACPATGTPTYCSDLQTDPNNCGSCGNACPIAGSSCVAGSCVCNYTQEAAGWFQGCAVKKDGTVSCWGANNSYPNGTSRSNSPTFGSSLPTPVAGLSGVKKVVSGSNVACALKTDGTVWCWGGNGDGQLGINEPSSGPGQQSPVQVQLLGTELPDGGVGMADGGAGSPGFLTGAVDLSAHHAHVCAVDGNGAAWCWGMNAYGQLGDGTKVERDGAVQVVAPGIAFTKIAVGGGGVFTSSDQSHTCALTSAGQIYCWGDNQSLQSGQPGAGQVAVPTPVLVGAGGSPFTGAIQLSLGALHSCALKNDGSVWCWGQDSSGQLGDSNKTQTPYPVQVMTQTVAADGGTSLAPLASIVQVAAGELNTCARDSNGAAYCWGDNEKGELGVNDTSGNSTSTQVAVRVAGIDKVADISMGHKHTCALRTDGTLWCWGRANHGMTAGATFSGNSNAGPTTPQPSPACY